MHWLLEGDSLEKQGKIKKNTWVKKREQAKSRIRERKRKLIKKIGKLLLVVLFLVGIAFGIEKIERFAVTSSYFQIDRVDFSGMVSLEREELKNMAGIELGENIFNINPKEIVQHLEAYYIIRSATVRRVLPRRVFVTIEERIGIASIEGKDRLYLIDREGFLFFLDFPKDKLPRITGVDKAKIKEGAQLIEDRLQLALDIIKYAEITFSEIDLSGRHLLLKTEETKIFFEEEQWEQRLADAALIVSDIQKRAEKAEYIDMRFTHPVIKLHQRCSSLVQKEGN